MFDTLLSANDVNLLLRNRYYNEKEKIIRLYFFTLSETIITTKDISVKNIAIINSMTTFTVILFFTRVLNIHMDLYSLFYKSSRYGNFVFEQDGSIVSSVFNKMVIAYCYYDRLTKKYYAPLDNIFNKKYLYKYLDTNLYIFDTKETVAIYSNKTKQSTNYLAFLKVYYKQSNVIHCIIKYKILL